MKKITFIIEFRDETNNKKDWSIVRETTISKALEVAEKICKVNNVKLVGIKEA